MVVASASTAPQRRPDTRHQAVANLASSAVEISNQAAPNAWLFEQWVNRHYLRNADIKDAEVELRTDRLQAIREILAADGLNDAFELAQQCTHPFAVGTLLSELTGDEHTNAIIPGRISEEDWSLNLALGFASHRHQNTAAEWINCQLQRCEDASQKAWLLAMLPFENATWDLVDSQEEQSSRSIGRGRATGEST